MAVVNAEQMTETEELYKSIAEEFRKPLQIADDSLSNVNDKIETFPLADKYNPEDPDPRYNNLESIQSRWSGERWHEYALLLEKWRECKNEADELTSQFNNALAMNKIDDTTFIIWFKQNYP
ncbi:MAG: hypothetical protein AAB657_02115 [Patescibacteria group bacterium]